MFNWALSAIDGIQTILLMIILMKKRPAFWKVVLFIFISAFTIEFIKPMLVAQGPSLVWNSIIGVTGFSIYHLGIQWIFRKPFHFAFVSASYIFVVFFLFQLFSFLIIMILGLWIELGESMLVISEVTYYSIILSVELFKPEWLRQPHQYVHAFVARRTHAKMFIDILLLILFFLFTTSFIFEAFHESPYMSNRIYSIAIFSLVFVMGFVVLLRTIVVSNRNIEFEKSEVEISKMLITIDQMLFQVDRNQEVQSLICRTLLPLYPNANTCESYRLAGNELIKSYSTASVESDSRSTAHEDYNDNDQNDSFVQSTVATDVSCQKINSSNRMKLQIPILFSGQLFILISLSGKDGYTFSDGDITRAQSIKRQIEHILEKHHAYQESIRASTYDQVTGLFNRHHTEIQVLQLMSEHEQKDPRFTLVLVTLLGTDHIRLEHGDEQLEEYLSSFADFLKDNATESQLIGRHSENEFILILPFPDRIAVDDYMTTIKKHLNDVPFELMKPHFHYGVSFYPDTARSLTRLISAADQQIVVNQRLRESMRIT